MASLVKPQMQCHSNLQFPDSRPRACSHRSLFVPRTPTRPRAKGQEPHFTDRLVHSVRYGSKVRQRTLLNLGRHFALPCGDGPALCAHVERILAPQRSLEFEACSPAVEDIALWAMRQLRLPPLLEEVGLSGPQRAAVLGSLVGRMAAPASERAAWHWLRQRSALGELLGCDSARPWAGTPCSAPATACCATATRSRRVSSSTPPTCSTCSPPSPCST